MNNKAQSASAVQKENPWITAKSKTYPDKTYYFNVETGVSVWNLRETGQKKPPAVTVLHSEAYREPNGPPPPSNVIQLNYHDLPSNQIVSQPNHVLPQTAHLLSRQIINDQFAQQYAYPNVMVPQMQGMQNMIFVPPTYNNKVFDVQTGHPLFMQSQIPTPQLPHLNARISTARLESSICKVQSTSVPLSSRFKAISEMNKEENKNKMKFQETANFKQPTFKRNINLTRPKNTSNLSGSAIIKGPITDLRQLLLAKNKSLKKPEVLIPPENDLMSDENAIETNLETLTMNDETLDEVEKNEHLVTSDDATTNFLSDTQLCPEPDSLEDEDENWLENIYKQTHPKINLEPLKLNLEIEDEDWYILPDTNVFISNLMFVKTLINSDKNCRLLLIYTVLKELMVCAESENGTRSEEQARLAMNFLEEMYDQDQVKRVDDSITDTGVSCPVGDDKILNSCVRLSKQDICFVILSNDKMLQQKLVISSVPVYTVNQLKRFLKPHQNTESNDNSEPKAPLMITVDNCFDNDFNTINTQNVKKHIIVNNEISHPVKTNIHVNNKDTSKTQLVQPVQKVIESIDNQTTFLNKIVAPPQPNMTNSKLSETTAWKRSLVNNQVQNNSSQKRTQLVIPTSSENNVKVCTNSCSSLKTQTSINCGMHPKPTITNKTLISTHSTKQTTKETRKIKLKRNITSSSNAIKETPLSSASVAQRKKSRWWRRKNSDLSKIDGAIPPLPTSNFVKNTSPVKKTVPTAISKSTPKKDSPKVTQNIAQDSDTECSPKERFRFSMAFPQNDNSQSRIVEESSYCSSDVISNTNSSIHSHNFNNSEHLLQPTTNKAADKNEECQQNDDDLLFQVDDSVMEKNIRTRSEEWSSRFLQIMYEVLTQIMQQYPISTDNVSPPWTIQEGIEFVKRKFWDNYEIQKASRNLTLVLGEASDSKGKILSNIEPIKFMELFSRGLFLVDSLMQILRKCEDVDAAMESLINLLRDIKYCDNMESFADDSREPVINFNENTGSNCEESEKGFVVLPNVSSPHTPDDVTMDSDPQKETEPAVTFVRNFNCDINLFKNFELKRNIVNNIGLDCAKKGETETRNDQSDESPTPDEVTAHFDTGKPSSTGPRVILNFQKCSEYEKRLQKRKSLDMDRLDYSDDEAMEDDEQVGDNDQYSESEFCGNETFSEDNYVRDPDNGSENIINFVNQFLAEIKEILLTVHSFCQDTHEELIKCNVITDTRKNELNEHADTFKTTMENLISTLKSILERESSEPNNNVQALLTDAGEALVLKDGQQSTYNDIISKCSSQAELLLDALTSIVHALSFTETS